MTVKLLIVALCFSLSLISCEIIYQDDDDMSGTIVFGGTPNLNDEMTNDPFIPLELQCDACIAIAYQLWRGLSEYNYKHPSLNYKLPESNLIFIMDDVCSDIDTWEKYGIKKYEKKARLSGPGMEIEKLPGVTASGGKWPYRLRTMCESIVGDHGEVTLYNVYKMDSSKTHLLRNFLCHGNNKRDRCKKMVREEL